MISVLWCWLIRAGMRFYFEVGVDMEGKRCWMSFRLEGYSG